MLDKTRFLLVVARFGICLETFGVVAVVLVNITHLRIYQTGDIIIAGCFDVLLGIEECKHRFYVFAAVAQNATVIEFRGNPFAGRTVSVVIVHRNACQRIVRHVDIVLVQRLRIYQRMTHGLSASAVAGGLPTLSS